MYRLLRVCGWFAASIYLIAPFVFLTQKSETEFWTAFASPIWILIAVVSFGLGHLVYRADQMVEIVRQLDGWKSREGDRFSVKGPSLMELLQQLRDREPPR